MARNRDYAAEHARRQARLKAAGTTHAKARKLTQKQRDAILDEIAMKDAGYAQTRPKAVRERVARKKAQTKPRVTRHKTADGEVTDAVVAEFRAEILRANALGIGPVTFAVVFDGSRKFISITGNAATALLNARRLPKGSMGDSGVGSRRHSGPVKLWTQDQAGFDPDDVIGWLDAHTTTTAALYALWLITDSPTMARRYVAPSRRVSKSRGRRK